MSEEKYNYDLGAGNTDYVSVLRELLHSIRGLSPVSSTEYVAVPEDDESEVSFK